MEPRLGPSTFEEVWAAHSRGLLRFFARRTLDPEAAMDLVSETFAAAFVARRRFRGRTEDEVAAYVYGIARRQLSHWYRTGAVRRRALGRLGLERPLFDDEELARVDEFAGSAGERAAVRAALAELSEGHRKALQLRIVEERSYGEIAALLRVNEQTARARVSRALRALSRNLELAEVPS